LNFNSKKSDAEESGSGKGLLDMIASASTAPTPVEEPAAATPAPPANIWTMVVLTGGDAPRQVQFQDGVRVDSTMPTDTSAPAPQEPMTDVTPTVEPPVDDPAPPFDPAADIDAEYDRID
jgi:hypothetical protein